MGQSVSRLAAAAAGLFVGFITGKLTTLLLKTRGVMADAAGPVARRIRDKLQSAFQPAHLDVLNESYMHNVPKGAETHFKVRFLCFGSGIQSVGGGRSVIQLCVQPCRWWWSRMRSRASR